MNAVRKTFYVMGLREIPFPCYLRNLTIMGKIDGRWVRRFINNTTFYVMSKQDKIHIDITQRSLDNKYAVWEQMYPDIEEVKRKPYMLPSWICTQVFKHKTAATHYCKRRFGRNCFKENEHVSIVFI